MKHFNFSMYFLIFLLLFNINPVNARILAPSGNENTPPPIASSDNRQTVDNSTKNAETDSTTIKGSTTNAEDTVEANTNTNNTNVQLLFSKVIIIHNSFNNNNFLKPMIGLMKHIEPSLQIIDTGVDIKKTNMLTNAYLLYNQTLFWEKGTVFIFDSGSKSTNLILVKTTNGQIIITNNDSILTLFANTNQIDTIRTLDTSTYKYKTIDGHDTIFYVAASIIQKQLDITRLGDEFSIKKLKLIKYPASKKVMPNEIEGTIFISPNRKHIITNISTELFSKTFKSVALEKQLFNVKITSDNNLLYRGTIYFNKDYLSNNKKKKELSFYKQFLIIKNISIANNKALANSNYKIIITKATPKKKS